MCDGIVFFVVFDGYGDHRDLHVLTHSFPTRRASDLWSKRTDAMASTTPTSRPPRNVSGSDDMPPTSVPASDLVSSSVKVPTFTICSGATSTPTMADRQDRKSTRLNSSH